MNSLCQCQCPEDITGELCETVDSTRPPDISESYNPKLTCNFEHNLCDWIQDQRRDSQNWIRTSETKDQVALRNKIKSSGHLSTFKLNKFEVY